MNYGTLRRFVRRLRWRWRIRKLERATGLRVISYFDVQDTDTIEMGPDDAVVVWQDVRGPGFGMRLEADEQNGPRRHEVALDVRELL